LNAEAVIFETAIRALAEGNYLRSTARIVHVDKDTACDWLDRAAQQCRQVLLYLWRDLSVTECQLDELWSFVHAKEAHLVMAKRVCESYGDAWIWIAFAPGWRMVLAFVVGKRTQAKANLWLHRVAHLTDQRIPFFTSDPLPDYRTALLQVSGRWVQPPRNGNRGRFPQPRRLPPPDLLYAQIVKHRRRGHIVAVTTKAIFGEPSAIATPLASLPTSTTGD
jgi:hypothetical protein